MGPENHVLGSGGRRVAHATVDIDSFPIEVHGKQHGAAYNGYYKKSVYHSLVASLSAYPKRGLTLSGEAKNPMKSTRRQRVRPLFG